MKKKLLTILLVFVLSSSFTACSNEGAENKEGPKPTEYKKDNISDGEIESQDPESSNDDNVTKKTLADIENFMLENSALSGEKTKMAADMVGAADGFKYKDSNVEIYEYDINSEEYAKLSNGEEISLNGMDGVTVKATAVNGKFVLIGNPSQEIIDIFNSFK